MTQLDYIRDLALFTTLRNRANAGIHLLASKPHDDLLYFDPIDIATQKIL